VSDQEREIDALTAKQKKLMADEFEAKKVYENYLTHSPPSDGARSPAPALGARLLDCPCAIEARLPGQEPGFLLRPRRRPASRTAEHSHVRRSPAELPPRRSRRCRDFASPGKVPSGPVKLYDHVTNPSVLVAVSGTAVPLSNADPLQNIVPLEIVISTFCTPEPVSAAVPVIGPVEAALIVPVGAELSKV